MRFEAWILLTKQCHTRLYQGGEEGGRTWRGPRRDYRICCRARSGPRGWGSPRRDSPTKRKTQLPLNPKLHLLLRFGYQIEEEKKGIDSRWRGREERVEKMGAWDIFFFFLFFSLRLEGGNGREEKRKRSRR